MVNLNEIKEGQRVRIISNSIIKHFLSIPQEVDILKIGYSNDNEGYYVEVKGKHMSDVYDCHQSVSINDIELIKPQIKTTTMDSKLVRQTAEALLKANNTVTTLEIKVELRKKYPHQAWYQSDISDVMNDFYSEGVFDYFDNGTYRVYSFPTSNSNNVTTTATIPSVNVTTTTKTPVTKTPVSSKKIGRTKVLDLIQGTNGRFFGVTFTKKDGTLRSMRCKVAKDVKPNVLGYVLVQAVGEDGSKFVNLQTISEVRTNRTIYTVS